MLRAFPSAGAGLDKSKSDSVGFCRILSDSGCEVFMLFIVVRSDVYLHNPRGSNNKCLPQLLLNVAETTHFQTCSNMFKHVQA